MNIRKLRLSRLSLLPLVIVLFSNIGLVYAAKKGAQLTTEELSEIVEGYTHKGKTGTVYKEYFEKGGTLRGIWGSDNKYTGKWELRANGCFYVDYDSEDDDDGCYKYFHYKPDKGKYKMESPSGSRSKVTVTEGDKL